MKLFKYLAPERLDVLKNRTIRFSQPAAFNDPFEFKPLVSSIARRDEINAMIDQQVEEMIEKEWSKLAPSLKLAITKNDYRKKMSSFIEGHRHIVHEQMSALGKEATKVINAQSNLNVGVLSLTEKSCNLLMWSHYADSHTGFCIGFNRNSQFFNRRRGESDEFYHLRKVDYQSKRPIKSMTDMDGTDLFLIKSLDWEYEQEWRICAPLEDSTVKLDEEPHPVHLFEFPGDAIAEVIVGCCASEQLVDEIKFIVNNDTSLAHVEIKRASVNETDFKLNFEKL